MAGSFFPDGVAAIREMLDSPTAVKAFYDIDTPITLSALHSQGRTSYLEAEQLPGLDLYFSFTGGPALEELESLGVPCAVPLYCSVDPAAHRPLPPSPKFACDLSYMGTYAPDRQPKLEELLCSPARALPQHKFFVAGPQYPGSIAWPKNVTREIHLEPKFHALLYSSSRLVLNVTRRDMVMAGYSPSVRLFEAAACGAAIVSDSWPGLDEFFVPGKEILLASGGADVESWITGLSSRELAGIGEAARARVLAEHTSEVRARQWEAEVEAARAPAATSAATM